MWFSSKRDKERDDKINELEQKVFELSMQVASVKNDGLIRIGEFPKPNYNGAWYWGSPVDKRPAIRVSEVVTMMIDRMGLELAHSKSAEETTLTPKQETPNAQVTGAAASSPRPVD
jgi:hypothetical protein